MEVRSGEGRGGLLQPMISCSTYNITMQTDCTPPPFPFFARCINIYQNHNYIQLLNKYIFNINQLHFYGKNNLSLYKKRNYLEFVTKLANC